MNASKPHSMDNHIGFCPHEHKCLELLQAEKRAADLVEQLEAAQRERDEYRVVNESVRVCAAHTSEIVGKGDCVICDLEGAYRRGIARGVQVADAESNPAKEREDSNLEVQA